MGLALTLSLVAAAMAKPQETACALVGFAGLTTALSDGTRVQARISASDEKQLAALLAVARTRIGNTFGAPRAQPVVLFFQDPDAFWPLQLNTYGSTSFLGTRTCVMVGPHGHNVDVVAHELMHAELAHRVGYWRRWTEVPTWFDEGVAMQVDHRPRYDLTPAEAASAASVRNLETGHQFFVADDRTLTWHYAAAKAEVAHWIATAGTSDLYERLEQVRSGVAFKDAFDGTNRP